MKVRIKNKDEKGNKNIVKKYIKKQVVNIKNFM